MSDSCFTLINGPDDQEPPSEQELKKDLEQKKVDIKIEALKKVIRMIMAGERFPSLVMTIIRYVMPNDDHMLKKLLSIYWEIVPKHGPDGKLLHELILVCDAYRKDLQHPNEFIRGCTLRFLCKLKEQDLIEPLMPSIQECLTHRHQYVRRNAVLCILTIYKTNSELIPDAPELIYGFLEREQDASCKRNAFMMLIAVDQPKALDYLSTCIDQVSTFNNILQLVIVELVHKVCRSDPSQRARFIRCIYNLLDSESSAVRYDAAGTLVTLSSVPAAIKAAATAYIDLIMKESDNNVKLIVLDRLADIKKTPAYERILQNMVMDILQVVAAPDLEVKKKTLDLSLGLISSRNVHDVVMFLKKEVAKTESNTEFEQSSEYRQLLIRTLHTCGVRFPEQAVQIVPQLMDFLSDSANDASAVDVILFVREAFERLPDMRDQMLEKLFENFELIKAAQVLRATMWIFGEYTNSAKNIMLVLEQIGNAIGELPIVDTELHEIAQAEESTDNDEPKVVTRTRITADGTYATESAYTSVATVAKEKPTFRKLILEGDFFVATTLATTLTKLSLKYSKLEDTTAAEKNAVSARCMLYMASIMHLGKSGIPTTAIDDDSYDRMMSCLRVLSEPSAEAIEVYLTKCHVAFAEMLAATSEAAAVAVEKKTIEVHADDLINFPALRSSEETGAGDDFDTILTKATGNSDADAGKESKLNKVFQLSGFSDPVYAEAYVHVNQYDILLDVIVVNQTPDTLQNLTLELATLGDLKLSEKTSSHTIGPHDFVNIKANVKVSSTETGIIFGNIVYDISGAGADRNCVVLNDIHIDIMDYISPAYCTESNFRSMWSEFEWENKVAVRTTITSLSGYLDHLMKTTNMRCLTPATALAGDCDFLAANLYAKSVFGEDALANLSIELTAGKVSGHIRIRSKTQGIALSLGDKITLNQKETANN
eukprot:m.147900 g.147900  ORF g.147900 m.147900 type:complete len:940 (+) comp30569_c0_seq2:169-2988(+)